MLVGTHAVHSSTARKVRKQTNCTLRAAWLTPLNYFMTPESIIVHFFLNATLRVVQSCARHVQCWS